VKTNLKKYTVAIATTVLAFSITSPTHATPLRLDYTVEDLGGGLFDYDFRLVVDNNDQSYVPGQGWNWIIFGDIRGPSGNTPSPLTNWVGDLSNSSPFITGFSESGGFHNGPTLLGTDNEFTESVLAVWKPKGVGDFLQWSGNSTANLLQGDLLFSTLQARLSESPPVDFGVRADFEVANRVNFLEPETVPEPASIFAYATVLGSGVLLKRWGQ
jgi:hypothetical protein